MKMCSIFYDMPMKLFREILIVLLQNLLDSDTQWFSIKINTFFSCFYNCMFSWHCYQVASKSPNYFFLLRAYLCSYPEVVIKIIELDRIFFAFCKRFLMKIDRISHDIPMYLSSSSSSNETFIQVFSSFIEIVQLIVTMETPGFWILDDFQVHFLLRLVPTSRYLSRIS